MAECTTTTDLFPACKSRKVEVDFNGGDITSDAGSLLLRQVDRKIGLTRDLNKVLRDPRRKGSCEHTQLAMYRQRIYGLILGYEDLNDHDTLRDDLALQTAVESDRALASSPTLCRLENRADREMVKEISMLIVEKFIASFRDAPTRLVLDFDATDDPVHGQQEGRFFHGYYDHYCFLPLYVFCGSQLLAAYLRPSNIDGARHAWAILSLLAKRLRKEWPKAEIIFRGDSGFCRWRMLRWCDNNRVGYIVGLAKNRRINAIGADLMAEAEERFEATGEKQRLFSETMYAAKTWDRERRVIMKAEYGRQGSNPRYVVTNLPGDPQKLYDRDYCARGDMENRIKEQQMDMFSDRTSCHNWWPNQLRLLLSSLAYILVESMRRLALKGTELARAQCGTIRLKLLKIGAVVIRNTRRVRMHLASGCPYKHLFWDVARRLALE
ncbi:MAG: IS1380 family transposase [Planctomycetes bacterium]|nr:IS1380 family transposase [Planctomycetota bacterium]